MEIGEYTNSIGDSSLVQKI